MGPRSVGTCASGTADGGKRSLVWFRKCLRMHDNPALLEAARDAAAVYPVYILDPWLLNPDRMGANRAQFLLESLADLDSRLRQRGSRLLCIEGEPEQVLPSLFEDLGINFLAFEFDTEPRSKRVDAEVRALAEARGISVHSPISHTLWDPEYLLAKAQGKTPTTYSQFTNLVGKCAPPPKPVASESANLPTMEAEERLGKRKVCVPSLEDIGFAHPPAGERAPFPGGETEGLSRLEASLSDTAWVAAFEKPKTSPAAFKKPSTTVLSPYLSFGCVSARLFHVKLQEVYKKHTKHAQPPVSLLGQLYWREHFYLCGHSIAHFGQMEGNRICRQIPWDGTKEGTKRLEAWAGAATGFPWIDAIMTQLRQQGWIHHLARHSVACFLTRGDLWVSWEQGRDVFEKLLLDADWSLNSANWMWLSCSSFFYQYFRCYSPVAFGKKYDPKGEYVKHFLPVLKDMPAKYIYEPWTAPLAVQKQAGCVVGVDYPSPIVDHATVSKRNMGLMADAYKKNKAQAGPAAAKPAKKARKG